MPKTPELDLERLRRDVKAAAAPARVSAAGTFAAVRAALPVIETLLAEGAQWQAIADALAAQGVTQGVGEKCRPITRSRLTAVVSELRAQQRRTAEKDKTRRKRTDLSMPLGGASSNKARLPKRASAAHSPAEAADRHKLQLAPELAGKQNGAKANGEEVVPDEEALRRSDLAVVKRFLKDSG